MAVAASKSAERSWNVYENKGNGQEVQESRLLDSQLLDLLKADG
jgi:hypothetical protein